MTNSGKLSVRWVKRENDIVYSYPNKQDGSLINFVFGGLHHFGKPEKTLLNELMHRGYDVTTLKFSIERKQGFLEVQAWMNFIHLCRYAPRSDFNVDQMDWNECKEVMSNPLIHTSVRQYAGIRLSWWDGQITYEEMLEYTEAQKKHIPKHLRWW
ncbi:MAG: hypothetical protein JWO15_3539 [Sphingomonadales bacterium]|nr:hypothetical protein [Sphingomonadales bacterium]